MRVPRIRIRIREVEEQPRRRRGGFNVLWAFLWLILLIIVLGLLFGGYRKGTPVHNPGSWITTGTAAAAISVPALSARPQ